MNKIKLFLIFLSLSATLTVSAKDYKASLFGVKSDGVTLNTGSIQKAIDFISEKGGGRLVFYVGRYLTGSIELKSNVTIQLEEGAILVASEAVYDYSDIHGKQALIIADNQQNIGITGKGVIEGQGAALLKNISAQVDKGYLPESALQSRPALITMNNCGNIAIEQINMYDACGDTQLYENCKNLSVKGITVKSNINKGTRGVILSECDAVKLADIFFDTSAEELIVHGASQNITVLNCKNAAGRKIQMQNK